jgi:hypothetical protein
LNPKLFPDFFALIEFGTANFHPPLFLTHPKLHSAPVIDFKTSRPVSQRAKNLEKVMIPVTCITFSPINLRSLSRKLTFA